MADPSLIAYLRRAYGSDVRAMIRLLYEFFQTLPPPGDITTARVKAAAGTLGND